MVSCLVLATREKRPHVPMMEELEVHVTAVANPKPVSDVPGTDTVAGNAGANVIKDAPSEIDESFTFWADWVDDD